MGLYSHFLFLQQFMKNSGRDEKTRGSQIWLDRKVLVKQLEYEITFFTYEFCGILMPRVSRNLESV